MLPAARLWRVAGLVDDIRHWDDTGESDVRDYLRFHLDEADARRLYEHISGDERLTDMVRNPLFLWMFRIAAERQAGKPPKDRGELLKGFVDSPRVIGRVDKKARPVTRQAFEEVGWTLQERGELETDLDTLYAALAQARGKRSKPTLDTLCDNLQSSGLLIDLDDGRYKVLHQLLQEYAAAAYLVRTQAEPYTAPRIGRKRWWRETAIAALWLDKELHTPDYLLALMTDPQIDLRMRVAAGEILGEVGDPRFVRRSYNGVDAIEPQMVTIPAGEATLGGDDPKPTTMRIPRVVSL